VKKFILVLTTVPEEKSGQKIAEQLVKEKLAACVTVSASSLSFYWWQGKIARETEHILFIKTNATLYQELEKRIREIHPYEIPEIIALDVYQGLKEYLAWIEKETKS
jgi:periplasmic divalent cation tolerance protein